jgi:hypothetical protein
MQKIYTIQTKKAFPPMLRIEILANAAVAVLIAAKLCQNYKNVTLDDTTPH